MEKLKVAVIGGGGKGFFGNAHKDAIGLLGSAEIVSGVLTDVDDPEQMDPIEAANEWGIKGYSRISDLIENAGKDGIDYALEATPNKEHYPHVKQFLQAGIPVLCEKPFTLTVAEAAELENLSKTGPIPVGLSYTYTGFWGMKLMREIILAGILGKVRKVDVSYLQGWLYRLMRVWRENPEIAGASCCGGDIGSHCEMAIRYITGLSIKEVLAAMNVFVPEHVLDDDFNVFARLSGGGFANIEATQIGVGHRNDHGIRVFCEGGTAEWREEDPEALTIYRPKKASATYYRGEEYDEEYDEDPLAEHVEKIDWSRSLPGGHGEAFHRALACIHRQFGEAVRGWQESGKKEVPEKDYPTASDGLEGMKFVHACVESNSQSNVWTPVKN